MPRWVDGGLDRTRDYFPGGWVVFISQVGRRERNETMYGALDGHVQSYCVEVLEVLLTAFSSPHFSFNTCLKVSKMADQKRRTIGLLLQLSC